MVRASVWIGPGWVVGEGEGVWLTDGGAGEERRGGYIPHSEALRGLSRHGCRYSRRRHGKGIGLGQSSPVMSSAHCSPLSPSPPSPSLVRFVPTTDKASSPSACM